MKVYKFNCIVKILANDRESAKRDLIEESERKFGLDDNLLSIQILEGEEDEDELA